MTRTKHHNNSSRRVALLGALQLSFSLIVVVAMLITNKVHFQADMLALLPTEDSASGVQWQQSEAAFFNQHQSKVVLSFTGEQHLKAHDQAHQDFTKKGWLSSEKVNPDINEIARFYSQYQGSLLSVANKQSLERGDNFDEQILSKLSESANPFVQASFELDPSLMIGNFIEQALVNTNGISQQDGRLVKQTPQGEVAILIVDLPKQAKDIVNAQLFATELLNTLNTIQSTYQNSVIKYSGIVFHTSENAQQAAFEMSLFGSLSLIAMIILVWYFFQGIQALSAVLLTLTNAITYGLLALFIVFKEVHLISFVFGITLIGIAIDYCFHYLTDKIEQGDTNLHNNAVRNAILLGFASTAIGYAMFLFTPIGFFAQIATFIIFGLTGAIVAVFTLVPQLANKAINDSRLKTTGQKLASIMASNRKNMLMVVLLSLGLLLAKQVFTPLTFDDNIALLSASSDKLLANEQSHQQLLFGTNHHRLLIRANNNQAALELEELLNQAIMSTESKAQVSAISNWVPSAKSQQENYQLLSNAENNQTFTQINTLLTQKITFPQFTLLTVEDALKSPIKSLVSPFYYRDSQAVTTLMQVSNIDKAKLAKLISPYANKVMLVDKAAQLSDLMTLARENLLLWLVIAIAIFTVVLWKKFTTRAAINAGAALLATIIISLLLSNVIQGPLNIFNALALVLILALAIDYLIFYQSRALHPMNVIAITLSALSSAFVFGLLVVSKTPAIFSFGLTVVIGLICIYFIAPLTIRGKYE
ncbi:hypothetical protein KO495_01565 [Colwellia sp. D2M02]|uniref:hypothetical protein n=1 Tax=Colwellia sp. D2M02 TaxID=2841562 RepID=UPI001C0A65E6|nr:hypothetical protein [Colwellia sp. D2M02]MBU2892007.1 hypothetical protein [Colwellia sp. D2M02]